MEMEYYGYGGIGELEFAVREFNRQVEENMIDPIGGEYCPEMIRPEDRMLFSKEGGVIKGYARYFHLDGEISPARKMATPYVLKSIRLDDIEKSEVVHLSYIESMERGTGHLMLDSIKSREDVKAIYLQPVDNDYVMQFYESNGFSSLSFHFGKIRMMMVWRDSV